ncbi:MAG: mycofactocin-associated electron transfer flavoprotein alpha subunit [Acidimicrobiales bacterium]
MIAVVPVRAGEPAAGGEAAVQEAGGRAVLAGDGAGQAAERLARAGAGREVLSLELPGFGPGSWARRLAPRLQAEGTIVLPASPDGRDLAPRLAAELGRPLMAGALRVLEAECWVVRHQGRQVARFRCEVPFVATLLPRAGAAGTDRAGSPQHVASASSGEVAEAQKPIGLQPGHDADTDTDTDTANREAELVTVLEADPVTMDLSEATRIFAAGAGIGNPESIQNLNAVAAVLGASVGATRVVTDAGMLGHERQIGTTGVAVRPRCYVAFGVSGAAQHLGGLGAPDHVISVNLDAGCPMMDMADLALVTDANELLAVLAARLAGSAEGDDG